MFKCVCPAYHSAHMMGIHKLALLACAVLVAAYLTVVTGVLESAYTGHRGRLPDFELETVADAGQRATAATFSRRPALVNVWASWCLACRTEHALLMELAESDRIALYGVNYLDGRNDAIRWLDYFGDPYDLSVHDSNGSLGRALGVDVVPGTYLIGPDGQILYGHVGPLDARVLDEEIWSRVAGTEADTE